jgi:hypothetical protein
MDCAQTPDMTKRGWYSDTRDAAVRHYWSGTAWTARRVWTGTHWIDSAAPRPAAVVMPSATAKPASVARKLANRAFLTIGSAGLAAIGCMLPWATQNYGYVSQTINGTSAGGGQVDLVLALVIAGLGVLFLIGRTGMKTNVLSLVLATLLVVICVANMADISNVIDKEHAAGGNVLAETGAGTQFGAGIAIVFVSGLFAILGLLLMQFGARAARSTHRQPPTRP